MSPPVKPEQDPGRMPTLNEWQAAQYAPHRFGQDPNAQLPMGRMPTLDEWQTMRRSSNPSKLTFPALPTPKFVADQTKRLNPNAGKPDQSILEQIDAKITPYTEAAGRHVGNVARGLDIIAPALSSVVPGSGMVAEAGSAVARQAVKPAVEHPIMTGAAIAAATASPIVVGGLFAADMLVNSAKYGYQFVHEQMMTPEERAIAQKDPNRISGEAALVQFAMLGLTLAGVGHAVGKAADVSQGVMESGAAALRPYVQSEPGATALGAAAAKRGLPPTASPYPPATPLDAAWKEGHTATTPKPEPTVTPSVDHNVYSDALPSDLFLLANRFVVEGNQEAATKAADAFASRPEGAAFHDALRRDFGDQITVYRTGPIRPGEYQSFTTSPEQAASFSRHHGGAAPETYTVRPEDVAFPGSGDNAELVIQSDKVQRAIAPTPEVAPPVTPEPAPKVKSTKFLDTEQTRRSYIDKTVGGYNTIHLAPDDVPVLGKTRTGLNIQKAQVHKGFDVTDVIDGRNVIVATIRFDKGALEHLVVRDAYQNKGIATDLLKFAKGQGYDVSRVAEGPVSDAGAAVINKFLASESAVAPTEPVAATGRQPAGLIPIEGTGETRTRGLATSTARVAERRGVEDDLSTLWGDLPEYRRMNLKDQATQALELIGRDPEAARRIALGDESAPSGLHPEAVFVALRNKARAEGDVGLIHDLATGGLTEQATTMGQRLRLLAENDPEDPVAKIRRIADKRAEGRGAPKAITNEVAAIGEHTKLNADILSKFLDSLKC